MSHRLKKITFVGGGSAYTPLIVDQFATNNRFDEIEEIVFVEPNSHKGLSISSFCKALLEKHNKYPKIILSETVNESIRNSDLIINIFRAGGLNGRHIDETIGNDLGILGQESQGFGGFSSVLRNLAVLKEIAPVIERNCHSALCINITNPSGILTYAARKMNLNAVGICDVPFAMKAKIAKTLNLEQNKLEMDYVGLNHLGWITELRYNEKSILDAQLNSPTINTLLKAIKQNNIPNVDMDYNFLKKIRAIPSSYLYYYYHEKELAKQLLKSSQSRAQRVMENNRKVYAKFDDLAIDDWPSFFGIGRGAYLLGDAVGEFISSYYGNHDSTHIICVPNNKCLTFLEREVVIEAPVTVKKGKLIPILNDYQPNTHLRSLISAVSRYEVMTAEAGLSGDIELAFQALASHPLIPTLEVAKELTNRVMKTFKEYLPQFS